MVGFDPMVTYEQMRDAYARRTAERAEADATEMVRLRSLLPAIVRHLQGLGAVEIYLFGSLTDGRFGADSDVDLATRGLGFHEALRAAATCAELLDRAVDVVRLEDAPPPLVARVTQTGVRLS